MHQLLRRHQPILGDQAADLISFGRALLGQLGANTVHCLDVLFRGLRLRLAGLTAPFL
jgi:hypothetical protein